MSENTENIVIDLVLEKRIKSILHREVRLEGLRYEINSSQCFIDIYATSEYFSKYLLVSIKMIRALEAIIEIQGLGSYENYYYPGYPAFRIIFREKEIKRNNNHPTINEVVRP